MQAWYAMILPIVWTQQLTTRQDNWSQVTENGQNDF